MIGQDPGQHENILRRILVGEAGRRGQGFLAKLGITRSYVLVNSLLYSAYGDRGARYVTQADITAYRDAWIDAILAPGKVQAVVTFGGMAKTSWDTYVKANGPSSKITVSNLTHPTFPEGAGGTKVQQAANTKKMLAEWNSKGLQALFGVVDQDVRTPTLVPYGNVFPGRAEKPSILHNRSPPRDPCVDVRR